MNVSAKRRGDELALVQKKVKVDGRTGAIIKTKPARTSNLLAPIMRLTGHGAAVNAVEFSPDGHSLATVGDDKHIFLWHTYGECENYMAIPAHKAMINEVHWSADGEKLYTASVDKSASIWDVDTGTRLKKCAAHRTYVNSVSPARQLTYLLCTATDDGTVKVWDDRAKKPQHAYESQYPILSACFNATTSQVFAAGISNDIAVWDIRKGEVLRTMQGHHDTVTGLRLSPDGSYLLSNAMDNTARIWDVRPFAPADRCLKVFTGHTHSAEKKLLRCNWSSDGERISAGSADRMTYIWDVATRKILYRLPGHKGSVNQVDFHPEEPIIASASSDKTIFLGEIETV